MWIFQEIGVGFYLNMGFNLDEYGKKGKDICVKMVQYKSNVVIHQQNMNKFR